MAKHASQIKTHIKIAFKVVISSSIHENLLIFDNMYII